MSYWRCIPWVVLLLVVGLVPVSTGADNAADELLKRLPEEIVAFAATSGGDALKADFDKTTLSKICKDQGVRSFCQAIKTELLAKAKQEAGDPNVGQQVDMVLQYVRLAADRPLVLGVAQVPVKEGPPVCGFVIMDAGERKAELAAAVGKLEALAGADQIGDREVGTLKLRGPKDREDLALYWGWVGNYLVLAVNDAAGTVVKSLTTPRAAVPAYLGKVQADGNALLVYGDLQKLGQLLSTFIRQDGEEEQAAMLAAVVKQLGLSQTRSLTVKVGLAGPDIVGHALVEMPAPATGLPAVYQPVDPAWFGAVDARAVTATAVNLALAALYDTIMNTFKTVSPDEAYAELQKGISAFESETKVRLRDGLLASLAGPMVVYTLPAGPIVDAPRGGFVVVAKLKDTALFEKTMTALGRYAAAQSNGSLQISKRTRDEGRAVYVWALAPLAMTGLMPAWSIASEHVVIGSTTELCDLGVQQLVSKGADAKSLLDTESYKKATAGLPGNLVSLTYTDSAAQLNQFMLQIQQFWPMVTMMAMQAGVKLPVMLPSLTEITKDMGPSCSYHYFGPDGFHWHYRGPGVEVSYMTVAGAGVGAAILMPALVKARGRAREVSSLSHLKQISVALNDYADQHEGRLPANLQVLQSYDLDAKALESPRKPRDFQGPGFLYVPGLSVNTRGASQYVVVYENPEFCEGKVGVLLLDYSIQDMERQEFLKRLEATYKLLGRPVPEVHFKGEKEVKPLAPKALGPSHA